MKNNFSGLEIKDQSIICLSGERAISQGSERRCFAHPHNSNFVIKVSLLPGVTACQANESEIKGYQMLKEESRDLSFVSHCHGYVSTDLGKGLLCDCIRDDNGNISKSIWDLVVFQENCDLQYIQTVAKNFCDFLRSNKIWLFDLNLKNIVMKRKDDGSYRPFVIDLKGRYETKEFIPISRYITYFSAKKLERRSRQLLERITDFHERREELKLLSR